MEKLNEIQKLASENLKDNIVLNAGAGTGKTRVLTRRYINILKNSDFDSDTVFDKILAITFTNKAAEEMKEKIKKELEASGDEKLKNLANYFSQANIFTIHGFCKDYIEKNAIKNGISLDFEVADSQVSDRLLLESIDDSLDFYKQDSRLYDYLRVMGNYKIDNLRELLFSLYHSMKNKSLNLDIVREKNQEFIKNHEKMGLENLSKLLEDYFKLGPGKKFTDFYNSQACKDFLKLPTYDFLTNIGKNLGTVKKQEVLDLRSEILAELEKISLSLEIDKQKYYELIIDLLEIATDFYKKLKKENNIVDYSDLEDLALSLLKKQGKGQYKYILVDEFQDTNKTQVDLLKCLTEDLSDQVNLFVVGDPKQSIYGFRGGNIESYKSFTKQMLGRGAVKLEMIENYRSSQKLIKSFNEIFSPLLGDDYVKVNANLAGDEKIKILAYENDEAIAIKNQVKELLESGLDENEIAVLFRTNKQIGPVKKELVRSGIRVNDSSNNFNDQNEINDLLIILRAIKNKRDIVNILAFFKTPYIGLDENSLIKLGLYFKEKQDLDEDIALKLEEPYKNLYLEGLKKLELFRTYYKYHSLSDMLIKILEELNYYQISAIVNGENSLINIDSFLSASKEYEAMSIKSHLSFIDYIENLNVDEDSYKQGVKLMTIHKSKGLEFDGVIIANAGGTLRSRAGGKIMIGSLGIGIDLDGSISKHSLLKEEEKEKQNQEEKRLFYVAMTRAKKSLILTSKVEDEDLKFSESSYLGMLFQNGFSDYELIKGKEEKNYLDHEFKIPNLEEIQGYSNYKIVDNFKEQDHFIGNKISSKKYLKYYTPTDFLSYLYDRNGFLKAYLLSYEEEIISENGRSEGNYQIDPKVLGNIVHKYAEISPQNIDDFIGSQFKLYGLDKNTDSSLIKKHMGVYDKLNRGEILYRELDFYYKFNESVIHGKIDQVRKVDGKYELVDIKTGKLDKEVIDLYKHQLHLYLIAIEKLKHIKIDRALLLSTLDQKEYQVDIGREELEKTLSKFSAFIKDIEFFE